MVVCEPCAKSRHWKCITSTEEGGVCNCPEFMDSDKPLVTRSQFEDIVLDVGVERGLWGYGVDAKESQKNIDDGKYRELCEELEKEHFIIGA